MKINETHDMVADGNPIKVLIKDDGFEGTFSIAIASKSSKVSQVILTPLEDGEYLEPILTLTPETMQGIFNRMWDLGFRPKDGTGNTGQIQALKAHLEDMRTLVFKD